MSYYIQMNELNNVDISVTLHSGKSATEMISTISNEMKRKFALFYCWKKKNSLIIDRVNIRGK